MATMDELAALRRATNIAPDDDVYTDELMSGIIDELGTVAAAAAAIWRERAGTYAGMVDTTESGSSRKLSDLHKNALEVAAGFESVAVVTTNPRRSFTVPVERQ